MLAFNWFGQSCANFLLVASHAFRCISHHHSHTTRHISHHTLPQELLLYKCKGYIYIYILIHVLSLIVQKKSWVTHWWLNSQELWSFFHLYQAQISLFAHASPRRLHIKSLSICSSKHGNRFQSVKFDTGHVVTEVNGQWKTWLCLQNEWAIHLFPKTKIFMTHC